MATYNGELVAAGIFSSAGGVPTSNIARWNGSNWQPLAAGTNGAVVSLAVYNGELVAAGSFTTAGGTATAGVARWNGLVWQSLGGVVSTGGTGLIVYGSDLYAFAQQWFLPGGTQSGMARWDGFTWSATGSSTTAPGPLTVYAGALLVKGLSTTTGFASPYLARWSPTIPLLAISQPSGAGGPVQISNQWLIPGHQYFNVFSLEVCPAGPGSGPYGGLCASNPASLVQQLLLPLGTTPFHFLATGANATFGPYQVPPGLTFDALCVDSVDLNAGTVGCFSPAQRYVVN
jgi:hypothetical protein